MPVAANLSRKDRSVLEGSIRALKKVESELQRRTSLSEPTWYEMPDLLCPQGYKFGEWDKASARIKRVRMAHPESDKDYKKRQNEALFRFVTTRLYITKDGRDIPIIVVPKMLEFVADVFFKRVNKVILWKGRGTGGSLCAAVLIWTCLVYHKMSFVDMAGALEQAKIVYDYVTQFWACIPGLQKNLVIGDPLISATKLATGAHLRCITPESMVLTDDGFKQIQNIRPGDMVFDGAGRMSAVKKVMVRWHDGDVVKLSPTGFGSGVRLTVDHKVASLNGLKSKGRDRIGGNNGWAESGTLAKGDRLVVPIFETDPGKKELSLVDFPRGKRREQSLVIDEDVMRFLGYWAADGTSYDRWISISFSKSQEAWVRDCCSIVRKCFKRSPTILRRENVDIVHFSFKGLASWLRVNCGKSVTKRLSWDVLMRSSDSELLEFLVGAIRGDGSFGEQVSKTGVKRVVSFTSVSPVFSEQVFLIGARLGLFPSLLLHKARKAVFGGKEYEGKPQYGVRFTGNGADRLADAAGFKWRARKSKSFQSGSMIGGWIERPVRKVSVEPYGGPVYDLEIDGHPSFMLPWVLAHNCITTTEKQARGKHVPGLTMDESSIVPGTMIMTKGGVRPIEEIESGDIVLSKGGEWNKVLRRISHPYSGKILKLRGCGDGVGAWITEEHRVFGTTSVGVTRKGKDRVFASRNTQIAPPDWARAWDFDVGDVLAYPKPRQRRGDSPEFLRSGDEQLWRFLGYWCGDGCSPVTKTGNYPVKLNLGKAKDFFVPDAMLCMEHVTGKLPKRYEFPSRSGSIDLVISSCKEWWDILRNQVGLSDARGIPAEWLETASDEDLQQFLIGLFRTDGGAATRPDGVLCGWVWVGTSSSLAMNVMYCTGRLGIPAYVTTQKTSRYGVPCKRTWSVKIRWPDAVNLLEEADLEGKKLPTKLFEPEQWCDDSKWYSVIQSIEEDYFDGQVYDLQVENDPSFGCLQRMMLHNCQRDGGSDDSFKAAMNITMSEPEHMIIMLSTFHVPVGMFQQYWDFAEERGFTRYKWTVYDVMSRCEEGSEFITEDDPEALGFCRTSCPLTEQVEVKGEDGRVIGTAYKGCDGKARKGSGFLGRENVINAKLMNTGSEIFDVEFACERPRFSGPIYGLESIERAVVEEIEDPNPEQGRLCAGVDWGTIEGSLVLLKDCGDFLTVVASRFISARIPSDFAEILYEWQDEHGHLEVFADASHPFNNNELDDMGFDITAVDFGVLKDDGVANLLRMFVHAKVKIIEEGNDRLIQQLKHFHRDQKTGKIVKKDDHGPDALMCASVTFDFRELWPELLTVRGREENKTQKRNLDEKGIDKDTSVLLF